METGTDGILRQARARRTPQARTAGGPCSGHTAPDWLNGVRIALPTATMPTIEPRVLPSGAVALDHPEHGLLFCDARRSAQLDGSAAQALRRHLLRASTLCTILRETDGFHRHDDPPRVLPSQSCTMLADAAPLIAWIPDVAGWPYGAAIQWRAGGAVAWPFVPSPDAASSSPILFPSESGDADLQAHLQTHWPRAASMLAGTPDLMLLGIDPGPSSSLDSAQMRAVLRDVLDDQGSFFCETLAPEQFVPLRSQMASYVARIIPRGTRLGALLPPSSAADLYRRARRAAVHKAGHVIIHAPGWGLAHRIDGLTGDEIGNAAWFGVAGAPLLSQRP